MAARRSSNATPIDDHRLFGAADALLDAMHSDDGKKTVLRICLFDQGAAASKGFTLNELTEAMSLLLRLGLVEPTGAGS